MAFYCNLTSQKKSYKHLENNWEIIRSHGWMSSIPATSCNSLTLCEPWFKLQSLFYGQRQQQYAAIISILLELLVALSSSSLRNKNGTWCPWVPFESFFQRLGFTLLWGNLGFPLRLGPSLSTPAVWHSAAASLERVHHFFVVPGFCLDGGDCGEFFGWQWYVGEHRCHGYLSKSRLGWSFH